MKRLRTLFQLAIVAAAATAGIRYAMGYSRTSIEKFCPFGGLETAYAFLTQRRFDCAMGELNLALFLALLLLTLLARKAFCSWVCPVGAVSEWAAALGWKRLRRRRKDRDGSALCGLEPPGRADRVLRWLRLPVLAAILYFTYRTGELVFRGYDPYYILFSVHGHDVEMGSYAVLAVFLAAVLLIPMAWCRYLCPLGAALTPFSALGRLRLRRNEAACSACGACDRACPQAIRVSKLAEVRSAECTLCLDCAAACPTKNVLDLRAEAFRR